VYLNLFICGLFVLKYCPIINTAINTRVKGTGVTNVTKKKKERALYKKQIQLCNNLILV